MNRYVYLSRQHAMTIQELQERLTAIHEQRAGLVNKAEDAKRDMTEDERTDFDALGVEFNNVESEIRARIELEQAASRMAEPDPSNSTADPRKLKTRASVVKERITDDPKSGFRSFGEFAMSVRGASLPGSEWDKRLHHLAPTTYGQEGVGADGGFAVPPDFRASIVEKVQAEDSLISLSDQLTSQGNTISVPVDETTPWQTSGGILAYWDGEGDQLTQSKPKIGERTIKLNKMTVLVPVTEEALADASQLQSYIGRRAPAKMVSKMNDTIINGTGAGQPQGLLNTPDLVSVAKESGQTAATLVGENIMKMWSRCYAPWRSNPNTVWIMNQDVEQQLPGLHITGTNGDNFLYQPPGGLTNGTWGTILGKRVVYAQACQTLGTKGDVFLAAMSQYMTGQKTGGIRADTSIHLYFDYDMTAFRFIWRVAGQSWWSSAITAANGSNSYSAFVSLDTRA